MSIRFFFFFLVILISQSTPPSATAAAKKPSLIRDAEIENTIRTFATPLFVAAGLNPSAIKFHLVKDDSLNAFVAGGMRIFLHTGLILRAERAGQLIGVIAHETGHIASGHLSRTSGAIRNATAATLLGFLLGGAAALGGRPDVGAAIMHGSAQMGVRTFLHFSRTQESAADQAAVRFLDAAGVSARGLYEFLKVLEDQDLLSVRLQDPYLRTHPITRDRIDFMTHHLERSGYSSAALSAEFVRLHARMRTKLFAFIRPLHRTLKKYPPTDVSVDARYARAIAYYLKPDLARALPLIDGLIAADRANPYFHELKGQMLFENGRVKEALAPYRTAVRLLPESSLLRISLAQTLIETGREAETREAARHLQSALADEKNNGFAWRLMATAHGRTGRMGLSFLALAEEALIQLRMREAIRLADKSKKKIAYGSPDWLRAEDIIAAATEGMSDEQKEKYKRDRESKGKPRRQR